MSRALSSLSWLTTVAIFLFVGIFYVSVFASQQKALAVVCSTDSPQGTYEGWCAITGFRYVPLPGIDDGKRASICAANCHQCGQVPCPVVNQPSCSSVGGICYHRLSCGPTYMDLSSGSCDQFGPQYSCCGARTCSSLGGNCSPSPAQCSADGGAVDYSGNSYCSQISYGYAGYCCVVPGVAPQPPVPVPPPPPRYDINGYVWVDTNRDGVKQSSEPYYTGHLTVALSGNASASVDTYTGTPGPYLFSGYLRGNYTVSIPAVPGGYVATTATSRSFSLNSDVFNINFGIVPIYTISGNVFNDMNKDRVKDIIDPVTNPVMEPNITSGITITTSGGNLSVNSSAGTYTISNLYEGLYTVYYTSAIPPSYFMIYPLNGPPPQFRIYVGTNCYLNANLSFGSTCYGLNNGNVQEVNFAISNSIPWFQTYGLNMRIDQGFEDKIPTTPNYPPYASVSDNANGASNLVTPTPSFTPTPTPTNTPSPTPPPNWGNCNATDQWGRSHPGVCYDRNTTSCQTYYDAGNFCPGGNSVQCCVNSQVACVSPHTNGFCHNRYSNYGGNIYPCSQTWYSGGYCPGPNDVQCCAP